MEPDLQKTDDASLALLFEPFTRGLTPLGSPVLVDTLKEPLALH